MRYRKQQYFLCTILAMWICTSMCYSQGLLFYGNEKRIHERTSYSVFDEENRPAFTDNLCITFDYSIKGAESSGYIFSLNDPETHKIYSFTYLYKDKDYRLFSFNEEGKRTLCTFKLHKDSLARPLTTISVSFDLPGDMAEIIIGHERQTIPHIGLNKKGFTPSIHFGIHDYMLDTGSFSIRNLSVSDGKRSWNFPLNENSGEDVHDDKGNIIGHVKNPGWLINQSYYWKKLLTIHSQTPSGLNYDDKAQQFYIFNQDSLAIYNLNTHTLSASPYANKLPVQLKLAMNFLDTRHDELYAYEVNSLSKDNPTVAALHPETKTWRQVGSSTLDTQRHHHAGYFNPSTGLYTLFGGYGSRKYYNSFLTYNPSDARWDTLSVTGDRITPRYFAGMAVTSDCKRVYVYGGMGNESGDQNVGRNYFYDLYVVDMEQKKSRKLWQQKVPAINRVVARNMIITTDEKYFYFLGYPEYMPNSQLQLYRVAVSDGSCVAMGDSIPMVSEEIATNANLFANSVQGEFYCSTQEFEKNGNVTTHIYSLAAPPVSLEAVTFYETRSAQPGWWVWLVFAVILISALTYIIYRAIRRRRKTQPEVAQDIITTRPTENPLPDVLTEEPVEFSPVSEIFPTHKNGIFLFGNFTVTDRKGRDITYLFSPKLRIIFLYIFLNSVSKEGVLSSDMNELFWADKPDDKIKNLKGVTLNHLRKIIQDIDGLELTFQKGYFRLVFSDDSYCDYLAFHALTENKQQISSTERYITDLIEILSRGRFLAGAESELFDYFKQKVENFIHSILPIQLRDMYRNRKYDTVVRLSNILFATDALSEPALSYYICSFQKMGMPDKALKRYHQFAKEYKREMNEDYKVSYESVTVPAN